MQDIALCIDCTYLAFVYTNTNVVGHSYNVFKDILRVGIISWKRGMHRVEIAVYIACSTAGGLEACSPGKISKI